MNFRLRSAGLLQLVVLLSGFGVMRAQEITASLGGLVKDPSDALVVGATVTVTHSETNNKRTVVTNSSGYYEVPFLRPGSYSITVAQAGFKTYSHDGIQLEINQHAQIDVTLQVGATSETVEVTAPASVIQTEDSSIGKVVDSTTIVNTPMNSRLNLVGLLTLAPGLQVTASQDAIPYTGVTMQLGGANPYGAVDFSINGTTNTTPYLERGFGEFPPFDGIREFKVITSGANAEFGKPDAIVIVTKSGSNDFHGTLLEFNRNRVTAAKNFFATALPNPAYNRNEFGGNFSGPVWIPKLYNGKNRSFFFVNYEGFRRVQASTLTSQVPTQAMRNGDFTGMATITDPLAAAPFPNNIIPSSRQSSITQRLAQLYPLPNLAGTGNNLVENVPYREGVDRTSIQMDHTIGPSDQIRGSLLQGLLGPNPQVGATSKFGGMSGIGEHNYNTSIGWNHIFSPTLVSETRLSYMHVRIFRVPQNNGLDLSYIPGLPSQMIPGAPQLTITNITSVSEQGSRDLDQTIQFMENVTKSTGSHTFKFGFGYTHSDHWNLAALAPQRGAYNFNGQYSGLGYSDFVLGYPSSTQLALPSAFAVRYKQPRFNMYVQDDWKVTRALTVSYGLRYEFQLIRPNSLGDNALFVPSLNKVVVFANNMPSDAIPLLVNNFSPVLASSAGLPTNVADYLGQDRNNFAPRLGLAYRLGQKTVMRASVGMFYNMIPTIDTGNPMTNNLPFNTAETFTQPTGATPTITMNNPFPGTGSVSANPVVQAEAKPVTPYSLQWNYTLERELPEHVGLRLSYVGQHNVKQKSDHATGSGLINTPDLNGIVPVAGSVQPHRPIQPYSNIYVNEAPIFQSHMHSLQLGAQKRIANGLLINAEYQYTRVLGTQGYINPMNWNDSVGNMNNIRTHLLVLSYSYEFPFGKGKAVLGSAHGVTDKLVSGWTLSGITTGGSGLPFSTSFTTSVQGSVGGRPNVVAGSSLYPTNKTISQWFNPAAFQAPPNFVYGNSAYDMLWGPGEQNWDMSLAKRTTIHERVTLQFKLDAFSAFNHPMFGNPASNISNAKTVGTITSATGNRTVQLGAKLQF